MNDIIFEIQSKIEGKILFNYNMGKSTWFRTGGNAKGYCIINKLKDLSTIVKYRDQIKYYIIGVGSNLLVRDSGFDGLIIKLGRNFNKIKIKKNDLSVGAGVLDLNLAKFASKNSIKDFEFFSGIPGTIGGAIKMNAGCYGSETSDNLKRVLIINQFGKIKFINVEDLKLGYRTSDINDKTIILKADFKFEYASQKEIIFKNNNIKMKRENSQPIKEKTSGSTFKNPPNHFAAELIEKSGCKGLEYGDAIVSDLHSNFLINKGRASAADIENLGKKIIEKVFNKFNILLDWEIKLVGE